MLRLSEGEADKQWISRPLRKAASKARSRLIFRVEVSESLGLNFGFIGRKRDQAYANCFEPVQQVEDLCFGAREQ